MSIYFIKNPENNTVRIGWAQSPKQRTAKLSETCGVVLELVGVLNKRKAHLELIQTAFKAENYLGEWYKISDRLADYLSNLDSVHKADTVVKINWETYEKLTKYRQKTYVPIRVAVNLAVEKFLKSEEAMKNE